MQCEKFIAAVFGRELTAGIKREPQRRAMRLNNYVWRDYPRLQAGMAVFQPRIMVLAHVIPRPAVESSVLHVRGVIRHEIVAQGVALVDRSPKLASLRVEGQTNRIADA